MRRGRRHFPRTEASIIPNPLLTQQDDRRQPHTEMNGRRRVAINPKAPRTKATTYED